MSHIPIILSYTIVFSGLSIATSQGNPSQLLFVEDFERSNSLNRFGDTGIEHTLNKSKIVSEPVRYGCCALKLTLDREAQDDPKPHRTDFWIRGMSHAFQMGEEYWFGFSTFLPEDFEPDTLGELFVQWINPDIRASPSLAIYIYGKSYQIRKRWGERNTLHKTLWRGEVYDGIEQWTDWVFHIRWSDGGNGLVRAWQNGQLIVSDIGPNTDRAGEFAPYFKFGIYKWPWRQSSKEAPSPVACRTLYFDEIRIGTVEAGFDGVAPSSETD